MGEMTVGQLRSFLAEYPEEAKISVCLQGENIFKDSCFLTDAMYTYCRRENKEEIILIYE